MKTQTDRKIAEEERKTYEIQEEAQKQRQLLVRETAMADIQQQVVASEQGVMIAELNANAPAVKAATGERVDPPARARPGGGDPRDRHGAGRGVPRGRRGARHLRATPRCR
jgi:hypothetical protein